MVNGKWHRIGYVVNEILNEVHNALNGGEIVQVEFSWVKYICDWTRSGPGFFAGVSVSKRGYWSHSVTRAASTRYLYDKTSFLCCNYKFLTWCMTVVKYDNMRVHGLAAS